jgi:hypothetical protein
MNEKFAMVPEWLIEAVPPRALQVYALLARYRDNDTGQCFPSRATLARRLRCSLDTIDRALVELTEAGALKCERRWDAVGDPTTNLYTVHLGGSRKNAATYPQPCGQGGRNNAARGSRTSAAQNESHFELEPLNERERALENRNEEKNPKGERVEIVDNFEPIDLDRGRNEEKTRGEVELVDNFAAVGLVRNEAERGAHKLLDKITARCPKATRAEWEGVFARARKMEDDYGCDATELIWARYDEGACWPSEYRAGFERIVPEALGGLFRVMADRRRRPEPEPEPSPTRRRPPVLPGGICSECLLSSPLACNCPEPAP